MTTILIVSLCPLLLKHPFEGYELLKPNLKLDCDLVSVSSLDSAPVLLHILVDQNEISSQVTETSQLSKQAFLENLENLRGEWTRLLDGQALFLIKDCLPRVLGMNFKIPHEVANQVVD